MKKGIHISTPLGTMWILSQGEALSNALFENQLSASSLAPYVKTEEDPLLGQAKRQLEEYFQGLRKEFTLPLAPEGSFFHQKVWKELTNVRFGKLSTYGKIAHTLDQSRAARAVGVACSRNPLPIFIPCHRIIGKNQKLVGYAGGVARKKLLLELESTLPFVSLSYEEAH